MNVDESQAQGWEKRERERQILGYDNIEDVKQSKTNTLTEEYKLFCMELGETVESIQLPFIHLTIILETLCKTYLTIIVITKF